MASIRPPGPARAATDEPMMTPPPVLSARRTELPLPAVAPGTRRALTVLRFGTPGARPKAYLQAGLHADELPGMLTLRHLAARLAEAEDRGEIAGEIIVVPVANPIGLDQRINGFLMGRYDQTTAGNYNRDYPDLAALIGDSLAGRLGTDAAANVATIRAAMAEALAGPEPLSEVDALRHRLVSLAFDADIVLDLHADNEAELHVYTGTPLWPDALDLASELDARAVLLAEISGGNPFDEACSGPWWALAKRHPEAVVPPACLAATIELRSNDAVDDRLADDDARAIYRFLERRGVLSTGGSGVLPRLRCEATPLDAMQQLKATSAGVVSYRRHLGEFVYLGEIVADVIDPLGDSVPVAATTDGILFARHSQTWAWPGKVIGKIAGAVPLPERRGRLLTD